MKIDSIVYLRILRDVKMRAVKAGLFLVKSLSVAQTAQCLRALTFPMVPILIEFEPESWSLVCNVRMLYVCHVESI